MGLVTAIMGNSTPGGYGLMCGGSHSSPATERAVGSELERVGQTVTGKTGIGEHKP